MNSRNNVAVIDIGKTNAKVVLVDMITLSEIAVLKRPNTVLLSDDYPHFDIETLWNFVLESLESLQLTHGIDAITATAHGGSGVLLDENMNLATPIMDYEFDGPDAVASAYNHIRSPFEETGSPRMVGGLNFGAQMHWLFSQFPEVKKRTKTVVTYPQYWTGRLSGVWSTELTALACHTDLWCPAEGRASSMVQRLSWDKLLAPVRKANECIGSVLPTIAEKTGLPDGTPVFCGIHDSNASLYPHIVSQKKPFCVVSTGTWVVVMAVGGAPVQLDAARDTLMNVNGLGNPTPSAKFMGGREFDRLMEGRTTQFSNADIDAVFEKAAMLLPSLENATGPFQGREHSWTIDPANLSDGEYFIVVSLYLALVTAICIELTGSVGHVVVEGPFAENDLYKKMLSTATGRPVSGAYGTGTSIGAALLAAPEATNRLQPFEQVLWTHPRYKTYCAQWMAAV